jgi:hypothetical protein
MLIVIEGAGAGDMESIGDAPADAGEVIVRATCTLEFIGPKDLVCAYLLAYEPCNGEIMGTEVAGVVKKMLRLRIEEVG